MRRLVLAMIAVSVAALPLGAQAKKPKACAIFVNADATTISDPSPVTCEQDGDVAVVFCNNDPAAAHVMTVKKDMKDPSNKVVPVLVKDISKNVPKMKCDFSASKVLKAAIEDHYRYTITSGDLMIDPDLDVAPPSGIVVTPRARGAAPAGRRGRQ